MSVELTNFNTELLARKGTTPIRETADGVVEKIWAARDGSVITMPWLLAMAMEGRVFNCSLASTATKMTGAVDYGATHPGICMVIPTGSTMIPVHLDVHCQDAAGTDTSIVVMVDSGDLYASGGTAVAAVTNLRTDSPYASVVTKKYASDSAITITDPGIGETILYTYENAFADATTSPPMILDWNPMPPPVLVGPATFLVYTYATTTAVEFGFSIQWVELPSNSIV